MSLNGIKTIRLKVLKNQKGDLLKYIDKNSKFFKKFGETYFAEIKKNYEKGWNFHKRYYCLLTVPFGKVRFTFLSNIIDILYISFSFLFFLLLLFTLPTYQYCIY